MDHQSTELLSSNHQPQNTTNHSSESHDECGLLNQQSGHDTMSVFKKAVIICNSSDLTTSGTTTYRPNNIVVELLKKDPMRYSKFTFYKFTSEKEIREVLCKHFTILRNKSNNVVIHHVEASVHSLGSFGTTPIIKHTSGRIITPLLAMFWFSSSDQYGKLNFHNSDEWTGRNIRRWLPGSSAMYLILNGDRRKMQTLSSLLKEDSLVTPRSSPSSGISCTTTRPCVSSNAVTSWQNRNSQEAPPEYVCSTAQPAVHDSPLPIISHTKSSRQSISGTSSEKSFSVNPNRQTDCKSTTQLYEKETNNINNDNFNVVKTVTSITGEAVRSRVLPVCTTAQANQISMNYKSSNTTTMSHESFSRPLYGINSICPKQEVIETIDETPSKKLRADDTYSDSSSTRGGSSNSRYDDDSSERRYSSFKRFKVTKKTSNRGKSLDAKKPREGPSFPREGRPSVITSSSITSIPFYMIPKFNTSPRPESDRSLKSAKELQERMFGNLGCKDVEGTQDLVSSCRAFFVPGGILPLEHSKQKEDESSLMPLTGKGNVAFVPIGFTLPPLSSESVSLCAINTMTISEMELLNKMAVNASLVQNTFQSQTTEEDQDKNGDDKTRSCSAIPEHEYKSNESTSTPALEVDTESKTSQVVSFDSLVDVFLAEDEMETIEASADPDILVEEVIPHSGFCEGGETFIIILKKPIEERFSRTALMARFGTGPLTLLLRINLFALRGSAVPKSCRPGRVTLQVESDGGHVLGRTSYVYKNSFINSFTTVISSEKHGSQLLHSMIAKQDKGVQELLELLVYMSAKNNSRAVMEAIFSSPNGHAVFSRYKDRPRQPEHLAQAASHVELAEYLKNLKNRFTSENAAEETAKEGEAVEGRESNEDKSCEDFDEETDNLMLLSAIASRMGIELTTKANPITTSVSAASVIQNTSHSRVPSALASSSRQKYNVSESSTSSETPSNRVYTSSGSDHRPRIAGFLKKVFVLPWDSKYLPSQSELCKLRATRRTYGKVQFNAEMTEEEVKAQIRSSFAEVENTSFSLAVVDQTGKLVFYDGNWTGRIIRKKLRGNSVLYVIPCTEGEKAMM